MEDSGIAEHAESSLQFFLTIKKYNDLEFITTFVSSLATSVKDRLNSSCHKALKSDSDLAHSCWNVDGIR